MSKPLKSPDLPQIQFSNQHWQIIKSDVEALAPQEACGLLWGYRHENSFQVVDVRPVENVFKSPTRFRMNPKQQIQIFREMEDLNLQLVGIYHSHPNGPGHPSATDIDEAYYPESVYIILSPDSGAWRASGFLIREQQTTPVRIEICESNG